MLFAVLLVGVVLSSPIPFPDYEGLGMGYFLWGGNTEPICPTFDPGVDPGWRLPAIIKLQKNISAHSDDYRWEIPGNTQCIRVAQNECTFHSISTIFKGDISYSSNLFQQIKFHNNQNNEDFINISAFTGSPTYTRYHSLMYTNNRLLVSANAICPTYIYSFPAGETLSVTEEFKAAVNLLAPIYLPDTDYYPFIELWGSHYTTSLYTGSRYSRVHVFDHNGWNQMNWNKYNIPFVASTAYSVATNSCIGCNQTVINDANGYVSLAVNFFESAMGINPVHIFLSKLNWFNKSSWIPAPFDYTFAPISELLTADYFPGKRDIAQIRSNYLRALTTMWSSVYCPMCHEHEPDLTTPPIVTGYNQSTPDMNGDINVKCGEKSVILNCGIKTGVVNGEFDKFWSVYPKSNTECSGNDRFNATVFASCSATSVNSNYILTQNFTSKEAHVSIQCKSDDAISGCGMIPYRSGSTDWDFQKAVYPSSGNECYCKHKYGGECFAVCSKTIEFKETQSVESSGGLSVLTCGTNPHNKDSYYNMFACGIQLIGTTMPAKLTPQFYVNNYYQCTGYSQQPYILWATCGVFAGT